MSQWQAQLIRVLRGGGAGFEAEPDRVSGSQTQAAALEGELGETALLAGEHEGDVFVIFGVGWRRLAFFFFRGRRESGRRG